MTALDAPVICRHGAPFRHEALLYYGEDEFLAGTAPFVREALEAEEPVMVAVSAAKIDMLREELDGDARHVRFADMTMVGANPARIIPAWRDFLDARTAPGRGLWGIGEPIWAERGPAELVECQRHETLLNLAFAAAPGFRLLCPYDTETLAPAVIEEAHRSHPVVSRGRVRRESVVYRDLDAIAVPFAEPLPEPAAPPHTLTFRGTGPATFRALRAFVSRHAAQAELSAPRSDDLVLAVHELATNSVRHAGGEGTLRIWHDGVALICEVSDRGHIDHPLAGRERPLADQASGRGLWLINQLCDLVQVRTSHTGTTVRLHTSPVAAASNERDPGCRTTETR